MTFQFTVYKTLTGQIVSSGTQAQRNWCYMQAKDDESVYFGAARWDQYMVDGQPVDMPPKPSEAHVFDYGLRDWVDPRTLDDLKGQLKATVADLRWQAETRGITVDGVEVSTTREARATFKQALDDALDAGLEQIDFKALNGFVTLTLDQMRGIARATTAHVQSCFTAERVHVDAINALTELSTAMSYDTQAHWPP
ncbi:hypothetical protein H4CHR_02987 [Variovorax sp. PBS-H4]|uniref:DUF4376 domain-containing protein n=1 Tax=Variovorax sp. PBS-H4 TaxID=434008 RepID=UPI001316D9F6|nr:DUF4376 domain-containing protein [Variovorax sp. PBS-H4]VTU32315.1 hypothetical protein H4CHR_02987 [Variovorax sp. PBS-H4]